MLTRVFAAGALWGIWGIGFPVHSLAAARPAPVVSDTLQAAVPEGQTLEYHQVLQQAGRLQHLRHPWLRFPFPAGKSDQWKVRSGEKHSGPSALVVGPTGEAMGDFVFIRLALSRPRRVSL